MPTDREYIRRDDKGRVGNVGASDVEDASNKLHQRHLVFFKELDTATSTARTIPVMYTNHAIRIISASLMPVGSTAAGASNGTNFSTISLEYDDGAGGSDTQVGVLRTNTTALVALTKTALTLNASNVEVAASKQLMLITAKSGAGGEQLNAFTLDVVYQEV